MLFFLKAILSPSFDRVTYSPWEWAVMRSLFAFFALVPATPLNLSFRAQPQPTGVAQFVDITWITIGPVQELITFAFFAFLALYLVGFFPLTATIGLFVIHTLTGTLVNSQGAIHHNTQLIGLVLLGQILAHIYWRLKPNLALQRNPRLSADPLTPATLLIYHSQQLIAAGYVASGISKLINSRGEWISQIPNIPIQFEKNFAYRYYDHLEPPAQEASEGMIHFIAENPAAAQVLFGFGLFLEALCFLALMNRATLALWGLALWIMHHTISSVMGLGFAFNKAILLIFFINLPFWLFLAATQGHRYLQSKSAS
ncbi:MAG: hypothetical protein AAGD22_11475 [Verrucomicrobiota bacterium]